MVEQVATEYNNVIAFAFKGEITQDDFESVIIPAVKRQVGDIDEIRLVYILNTDIKKFTAGAWWEDAMLGVKNITKWHKSAIVTSDPHVKKFTEIFTYVMPGAFKAFDKHQENQAIAWAAS